MENPNSFAACKHFHCWFVQWAGRDQADFLFYKGDRRPTSVKGPFLSTRRRRPLRSHSLPSLASCSPAMFQVVLGAPRRLLKEGRESRQLVLVVVFVALLLDNMLLTVVGTSGAFSVEDGFALGRSRQHGPCLISSMSRLVKFVIWKRHGGCWGLAGTVGSRVWRLSNFRGSKQKQVQRCLAGKEDLLLHHYVFPWLLMIPETRGAVGIVYLWCFSCLVFANRITKSLPIPALWALPHSPALSGWQIIQCNQYSILVLL